MRSKSPKKSVVTLPPVPKVESRLPAVCAYAEKNVENRIKNTIEVKGDFII